MSKSALIGIIAVLSVALVGTMGYIAYENNNQKSTSTTQEGNNQPQTSSPNQDTSQSQSPNIPSPTSQPTFNQNQGEGIFIQNGKVFYFQGDNASEMTGDFTLSDGTQVKSNGSVIKKDGTKITLREGERYTAGQ